MNQDNNQKLTRTCPKCGMTLGEHSKQVCIHCGYSINIEETSSIQPQQNIPVSQNITQQVSTTHPVQKEVNVKLEEDKKDPSTFLILSSINLFLVMPFLTILILVISIFGALADAAFFSMVISCISYSYTITSVVAFIMSIVNVIKKGTFLKQSMKVMKWSFAIILILTLGNFLFSESLTSTSISDGLLEKDAIIFQNDRITIKQKGLKTSTLHVKYILEVESTDGDNYPHVDHIRINHCIVDGNIDYGENDNEYILKISKYTMEEYGINYIYSLDFELDEGTETYVVSAILKENTPSTSPLKKDFNPSKYQIVHENEYVTVYVPERDRNGVATAVILASKIEDDYNISYLFKHPTGGDYSDENLSGSFSMRDHTVKRIMINPIDNINPVINIHIRGDDRKIILEENVDLSSNK